MPAFGLKQAVNSTGAHPVTTIRLPVTEQAALLSEGRPARLAPQPEGRRLAFRLVYALFRVLLSSTGVTGGFEDQRGKVLSAATDRQPRIGSYLPPSFKAS